MDLCLWSGPIRSLLWALISLICKRRWLWLMIIYTTSMSSFLPFKWKPSFSNLTLHHHVTQESRPLFPVPKMVRISLYKSWYLLISDIRPNHLIRVPLLGSTWKLLPLEKAVQERKTLSQLSLNIKGVATTSILLTISAEKAMLCRDQIQIPRTSGKLSYHTQSPAYLRNPYVR